MIISDAKNSKISDGMLLALISIGQMDMARQAAEDYEGTIKKVFNGCQSFYDKDNWTGLNTEERTEFEKLKTAWKYLTGKDIKLNYNCPD